MSGILETSDEQAIDKVMQDQNASYLLHLSSYFSYRSRLSRPPFAS